MKKILAVLMCTVILIGLTACGSKADADIEGSDLIVAAQEAYKALDSGRLVITDTDTGKVQQKFTFRYDDKVLNYSYESTTNDEVYCEYNNGEDIQIQKSGEVKTYKWPSKYFKKYKRNDTHPNADTGIFFYEPKYIEKVTVDKNADETNVNYNYDIDKLSKKMTTETTDGKMTGFETTYVFDKDGNFLNLLESSSFEKDDEKTSFTYKIEIADRNEIKEVENPIKQ